jgi:hypothetical protein
MVACRKIVGLKPSSDDDRDRKKSRPTTASQTVREDKMADGDNGSPKASLKPDKWQEIYINQFSYFINLILGMATAAIGFCISHIINYQSNHNVSIDIFKWTTRALIISIFAGVCLTLVRLWIFDTRRACPDYNKKWLLVLSLSSFQLLSFAFGILYLGINVLYL